MARVNQRPWRRILSGVGPATLAFLMCACAAATRPPDPSRPRANQQPYPVTLGASEERAARALSVWRALVGEPSAAAPAPEFQPVTATLRALPRGTSAPLRLPKVIIKEGAEQTQEETRESLRRFIASAAPLLGAALRELSLVEVVEAGGGSKLARYRQSPFELPLRNGYGVLEITFTPDLRVTELSSTAIPEAERLGRAIANVARQVSSEQAAASLAGRALSYTDPAGMPQTRTVSAADNVRARELVVFPLLRAADQSALELHLAWEIAVTGQGEQLFVYVDAVTGEQLAAGPAPQT